MTETQIQLTQEAKGEAWTAYTPALTNITLGSGTVTGAYIKIGKTVHFRVRFTFGSGSSISGIMGFGLPFNATSGAEHPAPVWLLDSGTAAIPAAGLFSSNKIDIYAINSAATYGVLTATSSSVPMTWTTNDKVEIAATYEMA